MHVCHCEIKRIFDNFFLCYFDQKNRYKGGKGKIIKAPKRFEFKTCRSVGSALTHCAPLLGKDYGKEKKNIK